MAKHPERQETGYSFSDGVAAAGKSLELSVKDPHANLYYNPYQYWQVRDENTKQMLPPELAGLWMRSTTLSLLKIRWQGTAMPYIILQDTEQD